MTRPASPATPTGARPPASPRPARGRSRPRPEPAGAPAAGPRGRRRAFRRPASRPRGRPATSTAGWRCGASRRRRSAPTRRPRPATPSRRDETKLTLLRQPSAPRRRDAHSRSRCRCSSPTEPRGRVAYWRLRAERRAAGWALVERQDAGQVDGLVHLVARRRRRTASAASSLRLEDFELRMESGTLFPTPDDVGPTGLVFVGRGRVVFSPRPPSEREQLRQYSGAPTLDVAVGWAFVRVHPADFQRVVDADARSSPRPRPRQARRAEAERCSAQRAPRSFSLDAALPRSPWWLLPGRRRRGRRLPAAAAGACSRSRCPRARPRT